MKNQTLELLVVFIGVVMFVMVGAAQAQQKPNDGIENFYRPTTHAELITKLPRASGGRFGDDGSFFSGSGNCPEQIFIGSVEEGASIFGSIDINVNLQSDIIINCGQF